EPIEGSNESMAVELGPGMLDNIFDGIERPLKEIQNLSGAYIKKGINIDSLNREKVWKVTPLISVGETVNGGEIIAEISETKAIMNNEHVLPDVSGIVITVLAVWVVILEVI